MALIWAAGICWMAVEIVGVAPEGGSNNASAMTDATGASVNPDDVKRLEETLKAL